MQHSTQLQRIRSYVERRFCEAGAATDDVCESILVRDGSYCGRRFTSDTLQAVWFCEENEIKLYGAGGILLDAVRGEQFSGETVSVPFPTSVSAKAA